MGSCMGLASRLLRFGAVPFILLSLLGARPPEPGVEVSTAVGVGRWAVPSGCGRHSPLVEAPVDVRLRASDARGVTLHVEQEVAPTYVVPDIEGTRRLLASTTTIARVGLHRRKFGFELGPALPIRPHFDRPLLVPTAHVRVGAPKIYGHLGVFAQPTSGGLLHGLVELGVGHASERWRGELSLRPIGARAVVELPVGSGIRVGVDGSAAAGFGRGPDWRTTVRLTLGPEVWRPRSDDSIR